LSFFNIDENGFLVLKDSKTKLAKFSDVQIQSGSMAAIPLKNPDFNKSLLGALIIVSDQIQKFEESKGVMFLESISEIFSSILVSNLETGKSSF
jgi:uncharacterized protein YigA (DUF484 family)